MKIGLFGGTFNPIHFGHLRTITEVSENFELAKTILIPAAQPPHKPDQAIAAAPDRLAMIRMAVDRITEFQVSDIELNRAGLSYTIDTVKYFKSTLDKHHQIYLIMGIDAFLEIDTWKSYMDLFRLTPMIVMARPGEGTRNATSQREAVNGFLKEKISDQYRYARTKACHAHHEYQPIYLSHVSPLDISGTHIRQLVHQGKSIQFLVPQQVEHYIRQQGLYL